MIDLIKKTATPATEIRTVQIFSKEAPVFAHNPDGDDTALAVVPLSFMKRITKNIKHTSIHMIKDELIKEIKSVKTMAEYYELLATELAFNKTLEMLTDYTSGTLPDISL